MTVEPKKVIILEGILLLTDARLRDELNFSIFVDTPLDICLMRRIKRDVNERGRSMDSVMAQIKKPCARCSCNSLSLLTICGHYRAARRKPHRDRYIESENKSVL